MPEESGTKLFGTDGIRGRAGQFPLDDPTVRHIGASLTRLLTLDRGRPPKIIIGRDTRESGPRIADALAHGAICEGATVESAGVITTPGVAYITRAAGFDAGVVISASHNPYSDNGIKVFSPSGQKLADETERQIEAQVGAAQGGPATPASRRLHARESDHYRELYIDYLIDQIGDGLDMRGARMAVDCANGAASEIAPRVFESLGAVPDVIAARPDGRNINEGCGSLHTDGLARIVVDRRLSLGVAFDGDADRALFVDSAGTLVDGDHILLILARDLRMRGRLAGGVVVATVMSNLGLEVALRGLGIEMVRAPVGDRYVLDELLTRRASLGGEQSGHIIFPEISLAGDGIITAIELLRAVRDSGRELKELASALTRYPQVLVNVRVSRKPPLDELPEVKCEMERIEREMNGLGRLLVRYSGTENLARVMAEGQDQTQIEEQANRLASIIKEAIG